MWKATHNFNHIIATAAPNAKSQQCRHTASPGQAVQNLCPARAAFSSGHLTGGWNLNNQKYCAEFITLHSKWKTIHFKLQKPCALEGVILLLHVARRCAYNSNSMRWAGRLGLERGMLTFCTQFAFKIKMEYFPYLSCDRIESPCPWNCNSVGAGHGTYLPMPGFVLPHPRWALVKQKKLKLAWVSSSLRT